MKLDPQSGMMQYLSICYNNFMKTGKDTRRLSRSQTHYQFFKTVFDHLGLLSVNVFGMNKYVHSCLILYYKSIREIMKCNRCH